MSKKETFNSIIKHKRTIIFSLIALGLIILIMLIYVLTYANNKPKAFKSDSNVKIKNKCEYFDLQIVAEEISLKSDPYLKLKGIITNVKKEAKISNVTITFEAHTNWTSKTDATSSSEYSFYDKKTLIDPKSEYPSDVCKLSLNMAYPVTVLPLVKVKHPTVYAKVSYTRATPATTINPSGGTTTEVVYYKVCYNDLFDGNTIVKS